MQLIGPIWIAFAVNDRHEYGKPRFGFSAEHARGRVFDHMDR